MSDKQVKTFIAVFNQSVKDGDKEDSAYAKAIAAAKKIDKSEVKKSMNINKATMEDKKDYLRRALRNKFKQFEYLWCRDYDDEFVYFATDIYKDNQYKEGTFKVNYSFDDSGVNVTLGDDITEVVMESSYSDVSPDADNSIGVDVLSKTIKDTIVNTFKSIFSLENSVIKDKLDDCNLTDYVLSDEHISKDKGCVKVNKFIEEEMIAYEPLYCPPDTADYDGDGMTKEEIKKMVVNVNKSISDGTLQPNLFHKVPTKSFEFIKAFVNPWPCTVGDQEVAEGQPVLVVKYKNEKAWELRKKGVIRGPSIGARAMNVEFVDDNEGGEDNE